MQSNKHYVVNLEFNCEVLSKLEMFLLAKKNMNVCKLYVPAFVDE